MFFSWVYYYISVNHKTEDDILRSLNRLAQRKLLESLSAVRPESSITAAISDEQLKRYGLFRITPLLITGQGTAPCPVRGGHWGVPNNTILHRKEKIANIEKLCRKSMKYQYVTAFRSLCNWSCLL